MTPALAYTLLEVALREPSNLTKSYFIKIVIDYFNALDCKEFFKWGRDIMTFIFVMQTTLVKNEASKFYIELCHNQIKKIHNLAPKPKENPKVAVLITGQLRGDWEHILKKNLKNLIEPLKADMFLASWDEVALWAGIRGSPCWVDRNFSCLNPAVPQEINMNPDLLKKMPNVFEKLNQPIKSKETLKALENYDFKGIHLESEENFENKYKKNYMDITAIRESFNWNKALELMQEYEAKNNFKYDFIFRMRPDREHSIPQWYRSLEDNELVMDGGILGTGGEGILGKRDAMIKFLSLHTFEEFNFINHCCENIFYGWIHGILYCWLLFNNLKINHTTRITRVQNEGLREKLFPPDLSKELELDLANLKEKGISEERIQDYKDFFKLVKEYYEVEPEEVENYLNKHPLFIRLKEKAQNARNGAVARVKNHLAYKLGLAMVQNSKSFSGLLKMPFVLSAIAISHKKERKKTKQKLPNLESYNDYYDALRVQNYLSYKLGLAFLKACKNAASGGLIKFIFYDISKIKKEFKKARYGI